MQCTIERIKNLATKTKKQQKPTTQSETLLMSVRLNMKIVNKNVFTNDKSVNGLFNI